MPWLSSYLHTEGPEPEGVPPLLRLQQSLNLHFSQRAQASQNSESGAVLVKT
jgi:hypothetical protein